MKKPIANYLYSKLAATALLATTMGALTVALQAQTVPSAQKQDPLVGTWILTVKPSNGHVFFQIETYAPGGTITAIDNYSASGLETASVGPWIKVGPGKYYEDNYQFTYNPDGSFAGTFIVHAEDNLDASGNTYSGPYTYQIIDQNGTVIDQGWGTSTAVRVPVPEGPKP